MSLLACQFDPLHSDRAENASHQQGSATVNCVQVIHVIGYFSAWFTSRWGHKQGMAYGASAAPVVLPIMRKQIFFLPNYLYTELYRSMIYHPSRETVVLMNSTWSIMHIGTGQQHLSPYRTCPPPPSGRSQSLLKRIPS